MLFCVFHSHQQQLIIGNQTFRLPCSSPHQWYIAIHATFGSNSTRKLDQIAPSYASWNLFLLLVLLLPNYSHSHAINDTYRTARIYHINIYLHASLMHWGFRCLRATVEARIMHELNVIRLIHLRLFARVRNAQKLVYYCYSPETAIGLCKVYIISQSGQ